MSNYKLPFIVYWTLWDRTNPIWKPINKWQRCASLAKANRLKKLLLSQSNFIEVWIAERI